jgi:hypothetical protein
MLKPVVTELLEHVAGALERDVLPVLPHGNAAMQVLAAIAIIRRAAAALPLMPEVLWEDSLDIGETLAQLNFYALSPDAPLGHRLAASLAEAGLGSPRPTSLPDLTTSNYNLRKILADTIEAIVSSDVVDLHIVAVRDLLGRMVRRAAILKLGSF